MESEWYCFTYGYIRSDWLWRDIDDCYAAAVKHQKDLGREGQEIHIWRKRVEEVIGL